MGKHKLNLLRRPKVRQNWHRYNLFNISRILPIVPENNTIYWQKYRGKFETRNYFGEHVREGLWQEMYRSNMRAVVPLNPRKLAQTDGSELSLGRGTGLDGDEQQSRSFGRDPTRKKTPYWTMVYWPMERRLDIAMFRAMFASSPRQAKSFIRHGAVKVNGKKLTIPGYLLNPGDMFSVDPERVLFATGAKKPSETEAEAIRAAAELKIAEQKAVEEASKVKEAAKKAEIAATEAEVRGEKPKAATAEGEAKEGEENKTEESSAASESKENSEVKDKEADSEATRSEKKKTETKSAAEKTVNKGEDKEEERIDDGLLDSSKPYATPWRPREYLSAFAHIPRYLEVNHNICHAVYLRHPVARPGNSEIPHPFSYETMQLAHLWYVQRNKKVK